MVAPANAAPASPARRPSKRMRALRSLPQSWVAAYVLAIAAARVLLPPAATPIRSRRLRRALATTSSGSRSNEIPRTNAGTSANVAAAVRPRSATDRLESEQSVALEETFGDLLGRLLVDVDAGVELGHRFVVELRGDRVERVGDLRILVQHFLAHDRREVVRRRVVLVVFQHDEIERRDAAVGGRSEERVDLPVLERSVGKPRVHALNVVALELEPVGGLPPGQSVGPGVELGVRGKREFRIALHGLRI